MNKKIVFYYLTAAFLFSTGLLSIVLLSFNIYLQALGTSSWVFLGILLFYFFTSVPQFQKAGSWIARGFSFWKKGEIATVALAIEGELNSAQEGLNIESEGLVPFPAKVEWLEEQDAESFCDTFEGKVIIRMREHKYNARNIVWATLDYVAKGMVPYSRLYLDGELSNAVDFTMVKKLLSHNESALDFFYREVVVPEMRKDVLKETMKILDNLDKRGIFTRIFLEEIKELGLYLYPNEDEVARSETREFAESLNVYAMRPPGEKKGEPYIRSRIKVGLVLIADPTKLLMEGPMPYITWAAKCIADGAKSIYILSRRGKRIPAVDLAGKIARTLNLEIIRLNNFEEIVDDKVEKALCIKLARKVLEGAKTPITFSVVF